MKYLKDDAFHVSLIEILMKRSANNISGFFHKLSDYYYHEWKKEYANADMLKDLLDSNMAYVLSVLKNIYHYRHDIPIKYDYAVICKNYGDVSVELLLSKNHSDILELYIACKNKSYYYRFFCDNKDTKVLDEKTILLCK